MNGNEVVEALLRKLRLRGDAELAAALEMSPQAVRGWRARKELSPLQVANMIAGAKKAARGEAARESIVAIIEFFPIAPTRSSRGATWELFAATDTFREGLRAALEAKIGIYVFYDSRGRALYVGKTEKQKLWQEMRHAFNRGRGKQSLWRTDHPPGAGYDQDLVGRRPLKEVAVPLSELARYFTAWEVEAPMIPQVEAMLVRAFANDTLNERMEKLHHQKG